jgi:hypothetical protein
VNITVERYDEFFVAVPQIFDRMKSVALWSAKKKKKKGPSGATVPRLTSRFKMKKKFKKSLPTDPNFEDHAIGNTYFFCLIIIIEKLHFLKKF